MKPNLEGIRNQIERMPTEFCVSIKSRNKAGFYDLNRHAEDIFIPILKIVFGYTKLKNLNRGSKPFPAIDLGDLRVGVAIQVTATTSKIKVSETIEKFKSHKLFNQFKSLKILYLSEKPKKDRSFYKDTNGIFIFNYKDDVIDQHTLYAKIISDCTPAKTIKICKTLSLLLGKTDQEELKRKSVKSICDFKRLVANEWLARWAETESQES